jgi:toxin secretion/phage lysis holin
MIRTLAIFMGVDYATGLIKAWRNKELSSDIGRRGLGTKVQTLILIMVVRYIQTQSGIPIHFDDGAAFLYVLNEIISIFENCASSDVPIPAQWVGILTSLKTRLAKPATREQLLKLEGVSPSEEKV